MTLEKRKRRTSVEYVDHPWFHDVATRQSILESLPEGYDSIESGDLLTAEQEQSLFLQMNCMKYLAYQRSQRGDDVADRRAVSAMLKTSDEIRNRIVTANLGLIHSISNRMARNSEAREELVADGSLALIRIVEHFNVGLGFKFSTYAVRALTRELARSLNRYARRNELMRSSDSIEHLPMPVDDDHFDTEQQEIALQLLSELPDRERELLKIRYGFYGDSRRASYRTLSDRFGLSAERLRQLELKCYEYARQHFAVALGLTA